MCFLEIGPFITKKILCLYFVLKYTSLILMYPYKLSFAFSCIGKYFSFESKLMITRGEARRGKGEIGDGDKRVY